MIQFNLLPDVKQEHINAQRQRRLITAIASIVTLVAIALLVISFLTVDVVQKKQLSDLNKSITQKNGQLQAIPDLNKILTVQNQLNSLTGLHQQKPAGPRLFKYLDQTTPVNADISDLTMDYTQKTATITGTADALSTVNKYIDTLKYTTYTIGSGDQASGNPAKAFSDVVLSSFGRAQSRASYTINLNYDPAIFDITQDVKLSVPNLVTTHAALTQPSDLFKNGPKSASGSSAPSGPGAAAPSASGGGQ